MSKTTTTTKSKQTEIDQSKTVKPDLPKSPTQAELREAAKQVDDMKLPFDDQEKNGQTPNFDSIPETPSTTQGLGITAQQLGALSLSQMLVSAASPHMGFTAMQEQTAQLVFENIFMKDKLKKFVESDITQGAAVMAAPLLSGVIEKVKTMIQGRDPKSLSGIAERLRQCADDLDELSQTGLENYL